MGYLHELEERKKERNKERKERKKERKRGYPVVVYTRHSVHPALCTPRSIYKYKLIADRELATETRFSGTGMNILVQRSTCADWKEETE